MPQLQGGLQAPNVPQVSHGGGMFAHGGVGSKILAGLSAFATNASAGLGNPAALQNLQGQSQMRMMSMQQQMEYQRQLALAEQEARLRMLYPTGDFAQELLQGGTQPGTPEWTQAMHTRAQNSLDPVVITPQGPMLRSQIVNAPQAGAPAPQGVTFTPLGAGGPTQPASAPFRP